MSEPLSLLTVHAHPDDEASKGAGTVARYRKEGVHTTLVCCTGGEAGDIINPAMDRPEVRERLAEVRMEELDRAATIIGYKSVEMLGYLDSGMPDSEENAHPENFANADLDEAVGRLVAIIRRERPQVIVTYGDDQQGYPHPDHLRVHDISVPAFERACDQNWYPDAGPAWKPLKLYYTFWSRKRILGQHAAFERLGIESPYDAKWFDRPDKDHKITTSVEIGDFYEARRDGLLAHATQIDPDSKFWFGLPDDVARSIHPYDDYILAHSRVESDVPETDLFAGIRNPNTEAQR